MLTAKPNLLKDQGDDPSFNIRNPFATGFFSQNLQQWSFSRCLLGRICNPLYAASNQQVSVGTCGRDILPSLDKKIRAAHAGTLHNSFCCVRCIKIPANLEASLTVLRPMACLFHRRLRRKAAAPSTSPSSGNSQAISFLPLQKWVTTAAAGAEACPASQHLKYASSATALVGPIWL